jgi:hypothetical protein
VDGLLACVNILPPVVDMCAPSGSGIVDALKSRGVSAYGCSSAFENPLPHNPRWGITNPPYSLDVVDEIMRFQISRVIRGELEGFAALMRTNWDHASTRQDIFKNCSWYYGQVKLLFRPIWFEKKVGGHTPFHNFTWFVWHNEQQAYPRVMYYAPEKVKRVRSK